MDAWIRHGILAAALWPIAAVTLHAQDNDVPAGVTAEAIEEGQELFGGAGLCSACHGVNAEGGVGPSLTDSVWVHNEGTYEDIVASITSGFTAKESTSGIPMPPKGGGSLSEDQIQAVAAYVWSVSRPKP